MLHSHFFSSSSSSSSFAEFASRSWPTSIRTACSTSSSARAPASSTRSMRWLRRCLWTFLFLGRESIRAVLHFAAFCCSFADWSYARELPDFADSDQRNASNRISKRMCSTNSNTVARFLLFLHHHNHLACVRCRRSSSTPTTTAKSSCSSSTTAAACIATSPYVEFRDEFVEFWEIWRGELTRVVVVADRCQMALVDAGQFYESRSRISFRVPHRAPSV